MATVLVLGRLCDPSGELHLAEKSYEFSGRRRLTKTGDQAMHERFERRIENGLQEIQTSCRKKKQKPPV